METFFDASFVFFGYTFRRCEYKLDEFARFGTDYIEKNYGKKMWNVYKIACACAHIVSKLELCKELKKKFFFFWNVMQKQYLYMRTKETFAEHEMVEIIN